MIEVNNLTTRRIAGNFLKKVGEKTLLVEGAGKKDISIALVSSLKIKELNRKYRKKNKPTDVLSFEEINEPIISKKNKSFLGEVIICPAEVGKNAKEFKSDFRVELARILVHGVLHLLGYDHERGRAERKKMESIQEKILQSLKLRNF